MSNVDDTTALDLSRNVRADFLWSMPSVEQDDQSTATFIAGLFSVSLGVDLGCKFTAATSATSRVGRRQQVGNWRGN